MSKEAMKLVPVEPTEEMLKAMDECSKDGYDERLYAGHASSVYMAAVDAAPTQPLRHEHAEQLAKLGWQYFECPACGSEGAKAFPKPAQQEPYESPYNPNPVEYQYHYPDGSWHCSNGEVINGMRPDRARSLYALKDNT